MTTNPHDGTLHIVGFSVGQFDPNDELPTLPSYAYVTPGETSATAQAIAGCGGAWPLWLPMSILWADPATPAGPADITRDGIINFLDFAILSQAWMQPVQNCMPGDIVPLPLGDGNVDLLDLINMVENWLAQLE